MRQMKSPLTGKLTVLLTLLTFALPATAQTTNEAAAKVDKLFQNWNKSDTPGVAVGVIQNGGLIFSKGYGMADLEHDVPITPSSVFYAASVSKQFVTMAILLLEEQGKLRLDDEIQTYLPDFPSYQAPLTIRNFIHHTSGVRDSLTLWELSGRDIYDQIDEDAMYDLLKRQKELNFKPGEKYLYSNACYFMLALVVEKVSGQSIKAFAEENMFKPLGMTSTHFHDDQYHIVKDRVFSYSPSPEGYRNLIMRFDLVGSGGLYTNINDLFLWDQNFYDNKLGNGQQELVEKMTEDGVLNNGQSTGYAFGIKNGVHKGLKTVEHGGSLAGYRTYLIRYPEQNFSVIILANVSDFSSGSMARDVAEVFLKDVFTEDGVETVAEIPNQEAIKTSLSEEDLKAFTSRYFSRDTRILVEISYRDNKLQFQRGDKPKVPMASLSENSFRVVNPATDIVVSFAPDSAGNIEMALSFSGREALTFLPYVPIDFAPAVLESFAGTYFSEEVNATYKIGLKDGELALNINDAKMGNLQSLSKNLFINEQVGFFLFDGNGYTLDAGRVSNLKFTRQ